MKLATAKAYWQLMRMDKPIGSLLLLWPTLWALFLAADGLPNLHVLVVFCLGVLVMRSAGCVINDFADRNFDGNVARTIHRPFPSGRVSCKGALTLFTVLIAMALILVLSLNRLTICLSLIALLLAVSYPFMKRYMHMPQLVLGLAFSWAIPMAYAAQSGKLALITWLLFAANLCWTIAYDTMYAMVDREDDLSVGIKSSAILFGCHDKLAIGILQLVTVLLLNLVGYLAGLNEFYFWGLLAAFTLFIYQQYLIKNREKNACFNAFLNNNYVGLAIFVGLAVSQI